ncbi:MAG: hypothetical protein JJU11_12380 [Candidatus Sumerlaeia bacterium]|nr:hypothetical protein [Candidatus Sumerlaeia bacterium]
MSKNTEPVNMRWSAILVFLAVFVAMAIPYHPRTGWNVNTRLNLVFAVVERGTIVIDEYHETPPYDTGDKAYFEGHFYSDKIFGVSLLALPVYSVAHLLNGGPLSFHPAHYLMKTFAVAVPGGVGAALFFLLMARLGVPPRRAVVLTMLAVLGSMWLGYGTVFYPYIPGIAALLGGLYMVLFPPARRLTPLNCLGIGALLGGALLCDLVFGLAVFAVGVLWLARLLDQVGIIGLRAFAEAAGERSRLKHLIAYSCLFWVGVLLPLSTFAIYCYSIFGELTIPYRYEVDEFFREGMSRGLMGATTPDIAALWFLSIHPYRGIFFWSPLVIAGLVGCVLATRHYGKRMLIGWVGLGTFAAYLLFQSAYFQWWGGWAMGPRLMIPMLPLVLIGCGELLRGNAPLSFFARRERWEPIARWGTWSLGVLGVLLCLPLSLTEPQVPQGVPTEVLLSAGIQTPLPVPQFDILRAFYTGGITIWPGSRLAGEIGSDTTITNFLGVLIYLLLVGGLAFLARRQAPEKIPGLHRQDYPFATVDGTAAPLPPGGRD